MSHTHASPPSCEATAENSRSRTGPPSALHIRAAVLPLWRAERRHAMAVSRSGRAVAEVPAVGGGYKSDDGCGLADVGCQWATDACCVAAHATQGVGGEAKDIETPPTGAVLSPTFGARRVKGASRCVRGYDGEGGENLIGDRAKPFVGGRRKRLILRLRCLAPRHSTVRAWELPCCMVLAWTP
jgi:hypothetical protein